MKILLETVLLPLVVFMNSSDADTRGPRARLEHDLSGLPMQTHYRFMPTPPPPPGFINASEDLPKQTTQTPSNSADNPESSSGSKIKRAPGRPRGTGGGKGSGRGGSLPRKNVRPKFMPTERPLLHLTGPPNKTVDFMKNDVSLWLDENGNVLQADFKRNTLPYNGFFYRYNNFLVRLQLIDNHSTVIYVRQNTSLMAVRAPNPSSDYVMEPYEHLWFISFFWKFFKVDVDPATKKPFNIELANGNKIEPGHKPDKIIFPDITFYMFRAQPPTLEITGASLYPTIPPPH
ncbi:uncharacterized protein LOC117169510 isoform X2 [Belonocnema kinseyi]|uniref:uncharacterized protein LOC117169510 isoform X2 n=1 Tax=Belonocnema kinseyi TaxID=2817044 RepID=UPI00143DBDEB|nr:uncharacterized protein LOC117169510 isoform X2 [Belonocnema kinseyi]